MIKTVKLPYPILEVINLGDLHYGSSHCDRAAVKRMVNYIAENDNVFWVSTGDIFECALKSSNVADVYSSMPIDEEIEAMLELLKPIAHKCIGITSSNHSNRLVKATNLSPDKLLCKELDMSYLGHIATIRLMNSFNCGFFITLHHGAGGTGAMRGSKALKLERFGNIVKGSDIYMQGHTHTFQYFVNTEQYVDRKHYKIISREAHFTTTGHYLKYNGSYAEALGLSPAPIGSSRVIMSGSTGMNKKIKVDFLQV